MYLTLVFLILPTMSCVRVRTPNGSSLPKFPGRPEIPNVFPLPKSQECRADVDNPTSYLYFCTRHPISCTPPPSLSDPSGCNAKYHYGAREFVMQGQKTHARRCGNVGARHPDCRRGRQGLDSRRRAGERHRDVEGCCIGIDI